MLSRAVGRSENPGEQVSNVLGIIGPGLTDLSKSGDAIASPPPDPLGSDRPVEPYDD